MQARVPHELLRGGSKGALALWPLLMWYVAWTSASDLWRGVILSFPQSSREYALAYGAWSTAALVGPVLIMAAVLLAWRRGFMGRDTAVASILGVIAAAALTAWPEYKRLVAYRPSYPWSEMIQAIDFGVVLACGFGALAAAAGVRILRGQSSRGSKTQPVERAASDNFGHADWMDMDEARRLFDSSRPPLGGVVIGEGYRVDQDSTAHLPFDPQDRSTWGRGGKAPLLTFDLAWGGTHGLVFAGSGSYKTVSTAVPTLLSYKGPTVTLDPSAELAPMLSAARTKMGRRVVCVDPARPDETGFNALDWLDLDSPTIDTDLRSVVDWICGERKPATANQAGSSSGKEFFSGRGKALVEALLSDLVFDPELPDTERTLATLADRLGLPEAKMRKELGRVHEHSASSRARHLAGQLMGLVDETFSGVYGNMSEQTEWLANPRYAALVSGDAFTTSELAAGKLDLFLNIPMKALETTPALGRVILGALLNAVYEADGHLPGGRVVFLLDEVARLGFMSSLARARDAGRKYGITLVMLYQSEGQLLEQWGEGGKAAWFESASWRTHAAIGSLDQAKAVSEACGEHGVITNSQSSTSGKSGKPFEIGTASSGKSDQKAERGRRLITPSEILADTRADEQFVFVRGRKPLRCGRAIYFRRPEMVAAVSASRFAPARSEAAE
jgi:type IV secretion system protein VirD4